MRFCMPDLDAAIAMRRKPERPCPLAKGLVLAEPLPFLGSVLVLNQVEVAAEPVPGLAMYFAHRLEYRPMNQAAAHSDRIEFLRPGRVQLLDAMVFVRVRVYLTPDGRQRLPVHPPDVKCAEYRP